jgi:hypothetical protein
MAQRFKKVRLAELAELFDVCFGTVVDWADHGMIVEIDHEDATYEDVPTTFYNGLWFHPAVVRHLCDVHLGPILDPGYGKRREESMARVRATIRQRVVTVQATRRERET